MPISGAASSSRGSRARIRVKSGGFRSIVIFRAGERAIFVYGFAKNAGATIRPDELAGFKRLASEMLAYDDAALARVVASGALREVGSDEQDLSE